MTDFVTEGFILIDVSSLVDFTCAECTGSMHCGLDLSSSKGFAHDVVGKCPACESQVALFTTLGVRMRRGGTSPLHRSTHFTQHNMFTNTTNDHNWYNNST